MTLIIKKEQACNVCKKGIIISDMEIGELVCTNCGFVLLEKMEDQSPERIITGEGFKTTRIGSSYSLAKHDNGLATVIGNVDRDAFGRPLSASMKYKIDRLRMWDTRSQVHTTKSRNFRAAFSLLDRLRDSLVLSYMVNEKAAHIYRVAVGKGLVKGRTISDMMAASVYAACRHTETPRSLKEISRGANRDRKTVAKCYRLLLIELDLNMPIADPMKCVAKIASKIDMNEKIKRKALEIIRHATEVGIAVGKDPNGFAASALYLSCVISGVRITQKSVAQAAGVTEVTLRNRYKGLKIICLQ